MRYESLRELGREIKVIVCDLDQTLLNSQKQISNHNLIAIKAAQNKGIFVTISSGRIFTMLKTYAHELMIRGPLITTNGAAILDSRDDKLLWARPIVRSAARKILDFAKSKNYDYAALTDSTCYFSPNSIRIQKFYLYNKIAAEKSLPTIPLAYFNDDYNPIDGEIYKIIIDERNPGEIKEASDFLAAVEEVNTTTSEKGLLDVVSAGVDKGTGLAQLKRILDVKKEEICVFGDYCNDLPMFSEAGFPIAMGNAHEMVKQSALVVTDDYNDDGIANAIIKYIL